MTFAALPKLLQSSPDGSCLLTAEDRPSQTPGISLRAFHIASFGSSPGISLDITELEVPAACLAVTSFTNKSRCHLIGLDTSRLLLESTALQISHKNTEFMFQTRGQDIKKKTASPKTAGSHNCLIDCHRDVWTRFQSTLPSEDKQSHPHCAAPAASPSCRSCPLRSMHATSRNLCSHSRIVKGNQWAPSSPIFKYPVPCLKA